MAILQKFWRDQRGNTLQSITLAAAAIAVASIAGAQFLDKSVQTGALQQVAGIRTGASPDFAKVAANLPRPVDSNPQTLRQVSVDYTPTASIPVSLATPIILDPCTGMRK